MKKIILILILFLPLVYASEVDRTFEKSIVNKGEEIKVNYTVDPPNAEFWAVDEVIPEGWSVKDTAIYGRHLRFFRTNEPSSVYTFIAPINEGEYAFDEGEYQVFGDDKWYNFDNQSIIVATLFELLVYSPLNGMVYNKRTIYFNLTVENGVDEIRYIDYSDRIPKWIGLCSDCKEYGYLKKKRKSLSEGEHNLSINIIKNNNILDQETIGFFVDSKKPGIHKTFPRNNEYTNGTFIIEYTEDNLQDILLNYGIKGDMRSLLMNWCSKGKKQSCSAIVDLNDFDEQEIEYWFEITDIASNIDKSRETKVKVDLTTPQILNFSVWNEDKVVFFNIKIDDETAKIEYMDLNDRNPMFRTLCSKKLVCEKKRRFSIGEHNLIIRATDQASNMDEETSSFII